MRKLGAVESPVIEKTVRKKRTFHVKKVSVTWGLINLTLALLLYWDIRYSSMRIAMSDTMHIVAWYFEVLLCVVFSLNTLYHFLRYLGISITSSPVELYKPHWGLLGVKDSEPGFVTPRTRAESPKSQNPGLVLSQSYMQAPYSPSNPPFNHSALNFSPGPSSPRSMSPSSPLYSLNGSFLNNTTTPRYGGQQGNLSTSFNRSVLTPNTNLSSLFHDDSGLRSRQNSMRRSPMQPEDSITDTKDLEEFLRVQEEMDRKQMAGSPDHASGNGTGSGSSFWNYNRSLMDCYPLLRKYNYQLACRSPTSAKVKDDDTDDGPAQYEAHEVWFRVGVTVDDVDVWIEHLRKWLGQTVMSRLVMEIAAVNSLLRKHGADDMQIGEMSISQLKQLAVSKSQQIPTLNTLLPFLEVSANQEYLVARVNELGSGGCMSDFRWNSGSDYKGKPWAENLPTDAQIVMHMLCSYMDARLPGHPKYYGKTFSTLHFMQTPDKPDLEKKDNVIIYQTKMNPPHYKVVLTDDVWNLPKGRNNMFMAILLFLHHVKEKQHGMLGRVNLGMSGINVLWILEKHL